MLLRRSACAHLELHSDVMPLLVSAYLCIYFVLFFFSLPFLVMVKERSDVWWWFSD